MPRKARAAQSPTKKTKKAFIQSPRQKLPDTRLSTAGFKVVGTSSGCRRIWCEIRDHHNKPVSPRKSDQPDKFGRWAIQFGPDDCLKPSYTLPDYLVVSTTLAFSHVDGETDVRVVRLIEHAT